MTGAAELGSQRGGDPSTCWFTMAITDVALPLSLAASTHDTRTDGPMSGQRLSVSVTETSGIESESASGCATLSTPASLEKASEMGRRDSLAVRVCEGVCVDVAL